MQDNPVYIDLMEEIISFFNETVDHAVKKGIKKEMIILDPGIGFGKSYNHNLMIIRDFSKLADLGLPLLLGSSRKAFIGKIVDKTPEERDTGTMATVAAGILNGAHIVRVHNVRMARRPLRLLTQ
jgi:dihydropteroate synthase